MRERIRDELANHIGLEIDETDLGSPNAESVGLRDTSEACKDVLDQEHEGTTAGILPPQQDCPLASGARRRRNDRSPIGNHLGERPLTAIHQYRGSADPSPVQEFTRSKELLSVFVRLTGKFILSGISEAIGRGSKRGCRKVIGTERRQLAAPVVGTASGGDRPHRVGPYLLAPVLDTPLVGPTSSGMHDSADRHLYQEHSLALDRSLMNGHREWGSGAVVNRQTQSLASEGFRHALDSLLAIGRSVSNSQHDHAASSIREAGCRLSDEG